MGGGRQRGGLVQCDSRPRFPSFAPALLLLIAAIKRRAIVEEFEKAIAAAKEGLMIKQSNTPYENARSKAWIKVGCSACALPPLHHRLLRCASQAPIKILCSPCS